MSKKVCKTGEFSDISIGIAWCLAWGDTAEPQHPDVIEQMRGALESDRPLPDSAQPFLEQTQQLDELKFPTTHTEFEELVQEHQDLWNAKIGLVYGGATKIKQYVFDSAKIQEVRGASALLDRINLIEIPAFFGKSPESSLYTVHCQEVRKQLVREFPDTERVRKLLEALIPELIIYSTGGNILAFCPAAFVDDLADAIEWHYTHETLTANSCAVGDIFRLLEIRFGHLRETIEQTFWLEDYKQNLEHTLIQAYFVQADSEPEQEQAFKNRKSFNELVVRLTILFNQRRSGQIHKNRPHRRYPPMFETHPYLQRDGGNHESAILQVDRLPGKPFYSEPTLRKRLVGDRTKKNRADIPDWYPASQLDWQRGSVEPWVDRFKHFLKQHSDLQQKYYGSCSVESVKIAQTLRHVSNASKGFVGYIYADGNNMGGYIQKIHTPQEYQAFSQDVSLAIEDAVYHALAEHLHPHPLTASDDEDIKRQKGDLIHPFEIITIGGDDILLVVPANKALAIAQTIGKQFETELLTEKKGNRYRKLNKTYDPKAVQRYHSPDLTQNPSGRQQCDLSISSGVLITADNTPIYYADKLVSQLLKSAKQRAKELGKRSYCGGTVDFLTLKSVTMLSSNIKDFRDEGLTKSVSGSKLRLYATPYTLHELDGLIKTVQALHTVDFPKSQLYQIRSLLERGRHTAILNYRYFRVRLKHGQDALKTQFEEAWCNAKTNNGNLAPWMSDLGEKETAYETIWREMVDLYDFLKPESQEDNPQPDPTSTTAEMK
ncbi:MAG: type III-B CRISPR-associated protein Cas10/Cmr2 [Acaryochloris sp. RU_4_1]|nr:type III-B CRISPR-associated protein Cas10/Cmr2 [Leptolyngbyaceae cyanobacterium SU_3_3]NJM65373.1 type III-B CRISPR-associated protein Cas10/Cmr2 [Acaryochloris sp. RU_4_1]NJR54089.1 type III-B CRISPR-associated protein Cas10/Cmr2 [Acaryochloris sp. CRU_2_0]